MIPAALRNIIADEIEAFSDLTSDLGSRVAIDPVELLQRDIELQIPTRWSSNRHCQLVETADGWIAVNLAREDDRASVAAWLECDTGLEPWDAIAGLAPDRTSADLIARAVLLGLPVALVNETAAPEGQARAAARAVPICLRDMSVIDLSALWAGPLCGGLLAGAGMAVTKVEDPARPDPTREATPGHDRRLNGGKQRVSMMLSDQKLLEIISKADILITSARPHALARLGLTPEALFGRHPGLVWVAITAHGFYGPPAMRVGFGDDCAVAGGLVGWDKDGPRFLGDALADPLTGLSAAHRALRHVAEARSGIIDVALAPTAADFALRSGLR